jgi:hypothetical protein
MEFAHDEIRQFCREQRAMVILSTVYSIMYTVYVSLITERK